MLLKDKVAIITGGAGLNGLGFATARLMAAHGARVAVLDLARDRQRHNNRRTYVGTREDDPEHALRDTLPDWRPSPEELASHRERLAIVARTVSRLEVAQLRFVEDLPEKEIATRQGLTRFAVAGQLKRMRMTLRQALDDSE